MTALSKRIARLERVNAGAGRVIVLRVPQLHSSEQVRSHLARHNLVEQVNDLVVLLGNPTGRGQGWSAPKVTQMAGGR